MSYAIRVIDRGREKGAFLLEQEPMFGHDEDSRAPIPATDSEHYQVGMDLLSRIIGQVALKFIQAPELYVACSGGYGRELEKLTEGEGFRLLHSECGKERLEGKVYFNVNLEVIVSTEYCRSVGLPDILAASYVYVIVPVSSRPRDLVGWSNPKGHRRMAKREAEIGHEPIIMVNLNSADNYYWTEIHCSSQEALQLVLAEIVDYGTSMSIPILRG